MAENVHAGTRPLRADARNNRARLLAAARDVFVELGPSAPLDEVARRAGTGIGTLYRRFPDRAALARAVVLDALERTVEEATRAQAATTDPFDALIRYLHRVLDLRTTAVISVLLEQVSLAEPELATAGEAGAQALQDLIDAARQAGALRADVTFGDLATLVVRLSRPLPGAFTREQADQLGHRHLDLLVDGLRDTADPARTLDGPTVTRAQLRAMRDPDATRE